MNNSFEIVLRPDGRAELRTFRPDAPAKGEPLVGMARDSGGGPAAVLMGRLYYREEVLARLPHACRPACASDAALALAVFRHQGPRGLERLEGEFSLAVLDPARRRVYAMRDPLGSWPLYWTSACRPDGGRVLRVSTSLLHLRRWVPCTQLNLDFLASYLMYLHPFTELAGEDTVLRPVRRVPPGSIVAVGPAGHAEQVWRWDWLRDLPEVGKVTLEEAAEEFARRFREAVRQRLRDRAAAQLSGSMDSSYTVAVARDLLAAGAAPGRLPTLSLVYRLASLAPEQSYIRMVLDQGGPIDPHFLDGDAARHFQWFGPEGVPPHDEPFRGLYCLAMERLSVETAARTGVTVILTGHKAEQVADGQRLGLADLVRRGRWLAALREARRWAHGRGDSLWSVLSREGIAPLLPAELRDGLGCLLRGGYGRWPDLGDCSIPPWVRPSFARAHHLREKGLEMRRRLARPPLELSAMLFPLQTTGGDWPSWYLAAPRGMCFSHPYGDPRLLTFALALPSEVRERPGETKPLLQAATRGVLPEPVRTRRWKRSFNEVYWSGLLRNLPHLEEMVRRSEVGRLGIFDTEHLLGVLRQHALGIGNARSGGRIAATLALVAWFDQFQRVPSAEEAPAEVESFAAAETSEMQMTRPRLSRSLTQGQKDRQAPAEVAGVEPTTTINAGGGEPPPQSRDVTVHTTHSTASAPRNASHTNAACGHSPCSTRW
jgi:asparagine synthase (glutamine-hydrolysing)